MTYPMKNYRNLIVFIIASSALAQASVIEVGPWTGAVTSKSAIVKCVPKKDFQKIDLLLGEGENPNKWQKFPLSQSSGQSVSFHLTGLKPNSSYQYVIEVDGKPDREKIGKFQTFPENGTSFHFAFASCANTGSASPVFSAIKNSKPLFYMNVGDFHYEDINVNDPQLFRDAYHRVLSSTTQGELYRHVPFVYMWDDHDFAGNNSDGKSKARSAARQVYREMTPHYPLVEGGGDAAIYQSFEVGRVKFLLTDLRSERSPAAQKDDTSKTMFGEKQKAWFKRELLAAKGKYPLIFWVSSVPWITKESKDAMSPPDYWGSYATERRELCDFIAENQITGICLLSGDTHLLAADDGTNSDFSTTGKLKIPVLQAGPLDRPMSQKGGPYSQGVYLPRSGEGCYGHVNVEDMGSAIRVTFSGRNQSDEEKVTLSFTVPATSNKPSNP